MRLKPNKWDKRNEFERPEINWECSKNLRQQVFFVCPADEILFGGAAGGGKDQPLDSIIWTPFGEKRMGEISIGDQISNPYGGVSRVIGVYPQGRKSVYKFTFDDDATCEAGLEHLWMVRESNKRRFRKKPIIESEKWRIATTRQLIAEISKNKKLLTPLTRPIEFTLTTRYFSGRFPVEPYTLGVFLGDGHIGKEKLSLTSGDKEIVSKLSFQSSSNLQGTGCFEYIYSLENLKSFEKLGLRGKRSWEKFIPKQYKIAPLSVRWKLIQGLMDTDGYADSRGHASYSTTSEQLAKDVQFIAKSLGYKANLTQKETYYKKNGETVKCRTGYTVWIKGENQAGLFSLERKKNRCEGKDFNNGIGERARRITAITYSRETETQCIKVDHPNGLYITNDFIVTHNTESLIISSTGRGENGIFSNPNWKALLLRRTFPELEKSIIFRSHQLFAGKGKYDANKHRWDFRPNGGILDFGHIKNDDDVSKYQSAEYNWIGFDELTHFTERMYLFLFSRLRTTDKSIQCKVKSATNPGSIGHGWVKDRFIFEKEPNKIYAYESELADGTKTYWTRCFIPSFVYDNKYLVEADPNYVRRLQELPDVERRAFLYGDWDIFSGQFFQEFSEEYICEDFKIPMEWPQWVSMDYGFQSKCAIGFYTHDSSSDITYRWAEIYVSRKHPVEISKMIKDILGQRFSNLLGRYSDKRIMVRDEETEISTKEKFALEGIYFSVAKDDRVEGWRRTRELFLKDKEGKVKFKVFRSCKNFIEIIPRMIHDESNPEDMEKNAETHIADELRYFAISRKNYETEFETERENAIPFSSVTGYVGISKSNNFQPLRNRIGRLPGLTKGKNYFYDR